MVQLFSMTGSPNLCYAGGVAHNCVANGRVIRKTPFERVFIQPAAGDEGQALGKLLVRMHADHGLPRLWRMRHAFLGPRITQRQVEHAVATHANHIRIQHCADAALLRGVARLLDAGNVVGWFQGRSEYGQRALGHRSILADPRRESICERVTNRFKRRAWFRPYAPSLSSVHFPDFFTNGMPSEFMMAAATARPAARKSVPAVVHVDGTARVQAVPPARRRFYSLIQEFGKLTGVPVLLNTSFNLADEPIVESPADAIDAFLRSKLDFLVLGNSVVSRRMRR